MGSSKLHQYTNQQLHIARISRAIGHPARVTIIQYLVDHHCGTNVDFMGATKLCDATVSQHLTQLKVAGLLSETFIGKQHYYLLNPSASTRINSIQHLIDR